MNSTIKTFITLVTFLLQASSIFAQSYSWSLDKLKVTGDYPNYKYYVSPSSIPGRVMDIDNSTLSKTEQKCGEGALELDGYSQYVDFENPVSLPSGTAARSMSLWIKTTSVGEKRIAIAYGKDSNNQSMFIGQDGSSLIAGAYGAGNYFIIDNFWTVDVWHHVCLTYDGTTATLYADGLPVASGAKNWNLTLSKFYIGRNVNQTEYWSGMVDNVKLYDYAKSAKEVRQEVREGNVLAGYWDMENTTYAERMTIATINPAYSIHNRVGSYALTLNGTNQYANITSSPGFATGKHERTINVWAKTSSVSIGKRTIVAYGTNSTNQSMFIGQDGTDLIAGSAGNYFTVSNFWTTNVWHHLSLTYNGQVAMLYADGVLVRSGNKNWSLEASKAYVGRNVNDSEYWNGSVDGLYVSSSYMFDWQIQEDYASTPGDVPSDLAATMVSPSKINLTFTDNSSNETQFLARRSLTAGTGYSSTFPVTANSIDGFLAEGTTYYYIVRAVNDVSNSDFTSEVSATTMANPPTNLEVMTTTASNVYLTWTDNSSKETGYRIERSATSSESGFTSVATVAANQTRFVDNGLNDGTTYYYRVSAVYATDLLSTYSNQASALTVSVARETEIVDVMNGLVFFYQYDTKGRMKIKQVPGAEPVYMVYDKRDRLVLTQDGNQRAASPMEWTFTKYDMLNRPILTGIYKDTETRSPDDIQGSMQEDVNAFYAEATNNSDEWFEVRGSAVHGYSNQSFPKVGIVNDYLTVSYYDDYTFKTQMIAESINPDQFAYDNDQLIGDDKAQEENESSSVLGLVTASKVRNLVTNEWMWSVSYYDEKYRTIQAITQNQKGGLDKTTNVYDFVSKVLRTKTQHTISGAEVLATTRKFIYDHAGRLKETWHQLNKGTEVGANILLTRNEYNELGQLVDKKLHSTSSAGSDAKQQVDYLYNIRGWLSDVNDIEAPEENDFFSMKLNYNTPSSNGGEAQFNGNISEITWQGPDAKVNSYGYDYDVMNRLVEARYYNATDPTRNGRFNERIWDVEANGSGYDLNGNIKFLTRKGKTGFNALGQTTYGDMDNLTYDYKGNQLLRVSDSDVKTEGFKDGANIDNDDYHYDKNGNMDTDKNTGIDGATTAGGDSKISYNYLNLPEKVTKNTGEYVLYSYDATGRKLRQQVYDAANTLKKTSDYLGEYFYENDTLKFINHEEGRIVMTGTEPEYQYHLKDHLGNVRVTFTSKEETESSMATLEADNRLEENGEFLRYDKVRIVNSSALFDHTNNPAAGSCIRLSGSELEKTGLVKSLSVMPGDVVNMEVYAKYLDKDQINWTPLLLQLLNPIMSGSAGTVVDGASYGTNASNPFPFTGMNNTSASVGTGPKAYLNYIMFDRDFNPILPMDDPSQTNFVQVPVSAKEGGGNLDINPNGVPHALLSASLTVKQAGYLYIYLSNEEATPVEVYFDDFKVDHIKSPVIQTEDYYPFGLAFNSHKRENSITNQYQYNGKEKQDELGLDWLDYGARMYLPEIGRWGVVDPLGEKYQPASPYCYVADNPLKYVDPSGEDIHILYYTIGNKKGDDMLKAAAETRKRNIEEGENFDSENDKVIMIGVSDISDVQSMTEWAVDTFQEQYGKTAEVGVWSHAGWDGPIGSQATSRDALEGYQMTREGWGKIDFNWKDQGARMDFYGCNTGNDYGWQGNGPKYYVGSFAKSLSKLSNFKGAEVSGQASTAVPSFYPNQRSTNMARSMDYGWGIGETYMVGGNNEDGYQSLWFTSGTYPTANPMNVYKNGKKIKSEYQ